MSYFLGCSRLFYIFLNSILLFCISLLLVSCAGTNNNPNNKATNAKDDNALFPSYDYLENVRNYFGDIDNNSDQNFIKFFVEKDNYSDLTLKSIMFIADEKPVFILSQMANDYAIEYDYANQVNNIAVLYNDKIVTNNVDCKSILTTDSYSSIQYDNGYVLANNSKNIEVFDPKNCASLIVRPNKFGTKVIFAGGLINFVQNDTFNVYPLNDLQSYSIVQMPYNIMNIFANADSISKNLNYLLVADVKGDVGFYNVTSDMIENGFKLGFIPAKLSYTSVNINKITGNTIYKLSAISDKKSTGGKTVLLNIILEGEKILDSASQEIKDNCTLTAKTGVLYCDDLPYNRSNIEVLAPMNYTLYQEKNMVALQSPVYKKKHTVSYNHSTPTIYYEENENVFYLRDITGTLYKISALLNRNFNINKVNNNDKTEQILKKCDNNEPSLLVSELTITPNKINSLKKIYLMNGKQSGKFEFKIGESLRKGKRITKNVCYQYAEPLKTYKNYTLYQQNYDKATRLFFNPNGQN